MSIWSRIERRLGELAGDLIPDEYREKLADARQLLEAGDAEAAEELLEAMVDARPDHPGALSMLGAARLERGDADSALEAFDRALALDSDVPEAPLGRGEACLALARLAEAVGAFRGAVDAAGGDRAILALAYRGLGVSHRRSGDLDKAIRELRKAVAEAPRDALALAALGDALLADEDVSSQEAARHLSKAAELEDAPALASIGLGRISLGEGDAPAASDAFERALEIAEASGNKPAMADALIGRGDAAMLAGDHTDAHGLFLRALELAPNSHALHARIGDMHRAVDNVEEALASYERSIELGADSIVLRNALDTALLAGRIDEAVELGSRVLAADPTDPRALVATGLAQMSKSEYEAAKQTFLAAIATREDPEAHVALARLALAEDPGPTAGRAAAAEALAALRIAPTNTRALAVLGEARARELDQSVDAPAQATPQEGMYAVAMALHRLSLARSDLSQLAPDIARAASDFDEPLLVTVMGEFSSGKSSFVNAFIGEEIAPTGITPTTATINVLKHGRARAGRIVYRDGRVENLEWDAVLTTLRELGDEGAKAVRVVELMLPREELERVNLVDTPGLNSILPEHEQVARGFIARADAIVWLFTAGQAGKKSERAALESIRGEGVRVLGVLNKIDQLSGDDVQTVIDHVQTEIGELVEVVVPLSARHALDRTDGDDGNWSELAAALEERFFARAREIKLQAADRRISALIAQARSQLQAQRERATEAAEALRQAAQRAADARDAFIDGTVAEQRRNLAERAADLYRRAAREVLELVIPRKLPFGSHKATRADRDYLVSLLETGFEAALEPSRKQVVFDLRRAASETLSDLAEAADVIGGLPVKELERAFDDAVRLVEAQVFASCQAYLRGYLRGGYVDAFFRRDLPKLELDEDSVYHALFRDSPNLDEQIAVPLARAGYGALDSLCERLVHLSNVADVAAHDIEVGAGRALDAIDERRKGLTS